jgi:hypothetical protein
MTPLSPPLKWRNSIQLTGVMSQLTRAINACEDGAKVTIDLKTARNLMEICLQAKHTEEGHGV